MLTVVFSSRACSRCRLAMWALAARCMLVSEKATAAKAAMIFDFPEITTSRRMLISPCRVTPGLRAAGQPRFNLLINNDLYDFRDGVYVWLHRQCVAWDTPLGRFIYKRCEG